MQRKNTAKQTLLMLVLVTLAICAIGYTDLIIRPGYWMKTMVKAPIFFCVPLVYSWIFPAFHPFAMVRPNAKGLKLGLALGLGIYVVVVGFYLVASQVVDVSGIQTSLEENLGINEHNFLVVGLYVAVCNSFLEEWFFRGFVFQTLCHTSRFWAYTASSLAFAIYHIAIMEGMFGMGVIAMVLLGLFVGGTIFNYLNENNHNLYASWFCHSFANFAMMTIGCLVFME